MSWIIWDQFQLCSERPLQLCLHELFDPIWFQPLAEVLLEVHTAPPRHSRIEHIHKICLYILYYMCVIMCDCVCLHKHITLTYVYEQSNSDIMPHSIFCSFHTKSTEPPSSHPASPVLALLSHAHQREFLTIRLAHLIEFSRGKVDSEGPPCLENVKIRLKMVIPIPMDPNWLFTFL